MYQYIKHSELDKKKWDSALEKSVNSMPYAYSWYLDIVSPGWDALISGDYEIIFPLTHRKKFGISYLFQPLFIRYFDIYSCKQKPKKEEYIALLNELKKYFPFIEINLLSKLYDENVKRFEFTKLKAQHIYAGKGIPSPSHSLQQNLNKAEKEGLQEYVAMPSVYFTEQSSIELAEKIPDLGDPEYKMMKELIDACMYHQHGNCVGISDGKGGFYSGAFILEDAQYRILIHAYTSSNGKKNGSMSFLRYNLIKELEKQDKYFDFGGSNIEGVAEFNHYFGGIDYNYTAVKHNALPWPLKWIKK